VLSLGQRAVACKGFRWLEGMQCRWSDANSPPNGWAIRLTDDKGTWDVVEKGEWGGEPVLSVWPDLTDPATVGCLLDLVRREWGWSTMFAAQRDGEEWAVYAACDNGLIGDTPPVAVGAGEAGALVKALESAP